jgi:hypothetical protein
MRANKRAEPTLGTPAELREARLEIHMLLVFGFFAQLALLLVLSAVALLLRVRGQLGCSRFSACMSALALVGLVGQFYAVETVLVDGSSVLDNLCRVTSPARCDIG